ncbi:hypothetical protein ACFPVX_23090 [Cohnella faecalis]|uniref:Uncharacterized protein n=1 Tax=Cohnella faecalis TaxID=2315694 RepID=A0A398CJ78_9BACL|nr:hypothetical protein [Cohnella faecalis]RIE02395.1 hypothetical protein D3H35_16945 [Cohnella faecalis]
MSFFFNESVVINNPLRIFFLCGSNFVKNPQQVILNDEKYLIKDKRIVLQKFLESTYVGKNFRSIILEDKFMFSDNSRRHLNYNDINLKSLKSIELLTSLFSDFVLIIHESYSTAAEIGMFSTVESINEKLIILTPNEYSIDEDYFSGFMRLAYQNPIYSKHNIKRIQYNPGTYQFHISKYSRKFHTFFIENEIKGMLANSLSSCFNVLCEKNISFRNKANIYDRPSNYYQLVESSKIQVNLDSNDLLAYLISLFNVDQLRREFILNVDMTCLNVDSTSNRRKLLFKEGTRIVGKQFKDVIFNTLKVQIPNIETKFGPIEKIDRFIDFNVRNQVVNLYESISYFLYILFALSYININGDNTRFSISNTFEPVYREYKGLLHESNSTTKKIWRKR